MKICSWNINSVRLRENLVLRLLKKHSPDIICLQECKALVADIPIKSFSNIGYKYMIARGQKSYNGVAILSRVPFKNEFAVDFASLNQASHIAGELENGIIIHNFYVPAGGDEPDEGKNLKFAQKLKFLNDMKSWFDLNQSKKAILVGDLNIAPYEDDVWDHKKMNKVVSHTPLEIDNLFEVMEAGNWIDLFRKTQPTGKLYSWWSYRARDWNTADKGRRLDHIWSTPDLAKLNTDNFILRDIRGWERPSDHAPIFSIFDGISL